LWRSDRNHSRICRNEGRNSRRKCGYGHVVHFRGHLRSVRRPYPSVSPRRREDLGRDRDDPLMITFWVDGIPASQGSKRHVGNGRLIESDKKLPAWRKAIETTVAELHKGEPIDEPVIVRADFYLPKPKKPRWLTPATAL